MRSCWAIGSKGRTMLQIKGFFGLEFEHRIFIAAPPERGGGAFFQDKLEYMLQ